MIVQPPNAVVADTGWSLDSLALDVRVAPDAPLGTRLLVAGSAVLRAPATQSIGPTLLVAAGAMTFDTLVVAAGAFASWGGNWYPWPAAAPDADPSLVAAPYVVTRSRVGTTDVATHLMPRQASKAALFAAAIPPMVDVLARAYGPYPFDTFGIAAVPASVAPPGMVGRSEQGYFLAHEHALDDDTVNVALFAHELAHMWWPNLVDSKPPGDDMAVIWRWKAIPGRP